MVSSGAVRSAMFTAESSSGPTTSTGDVDGNGAVNISDVTTLIDYLLNNDTVINRENADIDGDGEVTTADVELLVKRLLGRAK